MTLAYLGLRQIIKKDINNYFISIGLVSYHLVGKQIAPQLVTSSILLGLKGLLKNKYIVTKELDKDRRSNEWILDLNKLQIDKVKNKENKDFYSSVELDCITSILNSDMKDKIPIIRFYCYLMTTVAKTGDKSGVGFTSYQDMALYTGICRQTISKYMNRLEENKAIYIHRSNDCIVDNGSIREIPNTYGDFANKDKIISVGKTHVENYGENAKRIRSSRQSTTRSASAKYNIILEDLKTTGEIRYKPEVMKEIYETLIDYNKRYKDEGKGLKDLSIFRDYNFYKGDA
jgi:DNA-binding transcriptional regulator YhcF (GntR family)